MLSLPWVVERPGMTLVPILRWFAVDCQPLATRRIWALTGPLDDRGSLCGVHLMLPQSTLTGVSERIDLEAVRSIAPGHCLVTLPTHMMQRPLAEVQGLALVAYIDALR